MEAEITSKQNIIDIINNVEHPEIANSLSELGMIRDIEFDAESKIISLTLVVPMMGIPIEIRDSIISGIAKAVGNKGAKLQVSLAEMNDEQRKKFFSLSKQNWKL